MKSIIYIDRNTICYYGGNVHTPIAFPFPKEIVTDMEIINESELSKQISEWVKTHKIEPTSSIILLASSIYFQKEIPDNTPPEKRPELKKIFVENVPFNETYIQEILIGKSILLVAINTDFVYKIRDIFYSCGFTVEAISPVAEIYGLQPVGSFSLQIAQDALKKISKDNGIPLHTAIETSITASEDILPKAESNRRLYIMLVIFFILIAILGALFYIRRKPKKIVKRTPVTNISPITAIPTIIPTIQEETISSSEGSLAKERISIQILNGSGIPGQADTMKQSLEGKGFNNITTGNANGAQSNRTLIIFKKEVDENSRNEITKAIKLYLDDYLVQEKEDIDSDVLIITAKHTVTTTPR